MPILDIFRPAPPAAVMLTDPAQIAAKYSRWQIRVLIFATLGYATFYLVRKNYSVVQPIIGADLHFSKKGLGLILTLHGIVYGISKFLNGFLADRSNACVFMATALIASALLNIWFGFSSSLVIFIIIWMLNGWFQGMGFPPCARLMANWFPPKELATKFSIWNSSHNIGSIGILLLGGFLVTGTFFSRQLFVPNWRLCFFVPAAIALVIAVVIWFMLPDTPPSVGLPEVAGTESPVDKEEKREDFKAFVGKKVFRNKYIWILSIANFFV
jgi:sugar phosphate permease